MFVILHNYSFHESKVSVNQLRINARMKIVQVLCSAIEMNRKSMLSAEDRTRSRTNEQKMLKRR